MRTRETLLIICVYSVASKSIRTLAMENFYVCYIK